MALTRLLNSRRFVRGAVVRFRGNFNNVLLRISTCTDAKLLTPHRWRQHFEAEAAARRHALPQLILGAD